MKTKFSAKNLSKVIDSLDDTSDIIGVKTVGLFNPSNNYFSEKTKIKIIDILNRVNCDLIDLGLQIKQAHWNLRGHGFIGIHESILDPSRDHIDDASDNISEYIAFLGGQIKAMKMDVCNTSELKDIDNSIGDVPTIIKQLYPQFVQMDHILRDAVKELDGVGDAIISNVLQDICRSLNSDMWKLVSELKPPYPSDYERQTLKVENALNPVYDI